MTAVTATRWEIGGEFHLPVEPPGPHHRWPDGAVWYALGRHALQALLSQLRTPRLWLPDYFCAEIARGWSELSEVALYEDDPSWPEPRWESLRPAPRDVVVGVNYFGVRAADPWRAWRDRTECVLVEDHAHDPASAWATASTADYAFSSLRKTLPVPDGAILWSPRGLPLPDQPAGGAEGGELKLAAMLLKGEYLAGGGDDSLKERFRRLQLDGEERLAESPAAGASPATRESLVRGVPLPWRARRSENTTRLIAALHGWELAEPLFAEWPADAAPLGAVFVFRSRAERDRVRGELREAGVYCPVHWADAAESASKRVRELAGRILTIPTDWRYSAADMTRIASLLRA